MENRSEKKKNVLKFVSERKKELFILLLVALILGFSAWKIFGKSNDSIMQSVANLNATEQKLCSLLCEMDGVGDAEVMICETEEGVQSVVVVCQGANDLRVILNIREAVAAALGMEEKAVKIYLKKE